MINSAMKAYEDENSLGRDGGRRRGGIVMFMVHANAWSIGHYDVACACGVWRVVAVSFFPPKSRRRFLF
jgi:hypothetical protein